MASTMQGLVCIASLNCPVMLGGLHLPLFIHMLQKKKRHHEEVLTSHRPPLLRDRSGIQPDSPRDYLHPHVLPNSNVYLCVCVSSDLCVYQVRISNKGAGTTEDRGGPGTVGDGESSESACPLPPCPAGPLPPMVPLGLEGRNPHTRIWETPVRIF